MNRRITLTLASLALGASLLGGCAIEHLGKSTTQAFNGIMDTQATVRLTELDAPNRMTGEDAEIVMKNRAGDRKRSTLGGAPAGGGVTLSLSR